MSESLTGSCAAAVMDSRACFSSVNSILAPAPAVARAVTSAETPAPRPPRCAFSRSGSRHPAEPGDRAVAGCSRQRQGRWPSWVSRPAAGSNWTRTSAADGYVLGPSELPELDVHDGQIGRQSGCPEAQQVLTAGVHLLHGGPQEPRRVVHVGRGTYAADVEAATRRQAPRSRSLRPLPNSPRRPPDPLALRPPRRQSGRRPCARIARRRSSRPHRRRSR